MGPPHPCCSIVTIAAVGLAALDSLRQRPGWESDTDEVFQLPSVGAGSAVHRRHLKAAGRSADSFGFDKATLLQLVGWWHRSSHRLDRCVSVVKTGDTDNASTKETIRTSGWEQASSAAFCFTVFGALMAVLLGLYAGSKHAPADGLKSFFRSIRGVAGSAHLAAKRLPKRNRRREDWAD
jgi:hypothetical protein